MFDRTRLFDNSEIFQVSLLDYSQNLKGWKLSTSVPAYFMKCNDCRINLENAKKRLFCKLSKTIRCEKCDKIENVCIPKIGELHEHFNISIMEKIKK